MISEPDLCIVLGRESCRTVSFGRGTMGQIKSVIFDWGGVLIDDPRPGLLQYCAKAFGVPEKDYVPAHDKFLETFQTGAMDEEVFWTNVCAELGRPKPRIRSLWGDAFRSAYVPRPEMFSMVSALHQNGYRTALLSNTEVPAMRFFHSLQYDMFDVTVFSCVEAVTKPDERIYRVTLDRLGTQPEQTAFIDDKQEFIDGAKRLGIEAIIFRHIAQAQDELVRRRVNYRTRNGDKGC